MDCPNCSQTFDNLNTCPNCGIDVVLLKKTEDVSNRLYNKALEQIERKDLTGAKENLIKSLEFSKVNYVARNLLGLVYFETGMLGDALKHWVISVNGKKEDNWAVKYINTIQNEARNLEKYNESIRMYNMSLQYLRQKSDDMALIQLRKALDLTPKLIEALNLQTLCHMMRNENDKAIIAAEKVLAQDINNPLALYYLSVIAPNRVRHDTVEKVVVRKERAKTVQSAYPRIQPPDKKSFYYAFHISEIITFIIGVICTIIWYNVLIMPDKLESSAQLLESKAAEVVEIEQSYLTRLEEKDKEIQTLQEEKRSLEETSEKLSQDIELFEREQKVALVQSHIAGGRAEEAAELLNSLSTEGFSLESMQAITEIKSQLYPVLEKKYYDEALSFYTRRDYEAAKPLFEKSMEYTAEGSFYIDDTNCFLGIIAESQGDTATAKRYYEWVIENFPNSNQISTVRSRYNRL